MTYSSYGSYSYYGYNSYGYDCYGYDKDGYDRSGYDCSGYDKTGYDKTGYDKTGYDRGGYDCDGYDKTGYDKDGYDRDGCTPDTPDEPVEDVECGEPITVTLATEDFNGLCSLDDSDGIVSDDGWTARNGGAYANGCSDGSLVFAELDSAGMDSVTLTFDIVSSNVCNFESEGCYADDFTVEFFNGSTWEVLDVFVRDGDQLVGSISGQSFGACNFSEITYTIADPGDVTQFRFTADFTASNEAILVDNVLVTADYTEACGDECEPTIVTLMTEDFDGLCAPQYSDNVDYDSNWRSKYDAAYADGCNDGKLVFSEVDTAGLSEVCFTFDIVSSNVCNFEADGCYADDLTVQYYDGTSWQTLDTFVRSGYEMVGSVTGQTFGDGDWSEISYTITDPGETIQFRIVADFTASNEAVLVDNVEICGVIPADCGPELGSLGDFIWLDVDQDGIQDDNEVGVAGITVELIQDGVATGRTVTTGVDGKYLFDELTAGNYAVQISGIAEGYQITTQNAGTDEGKDSDVNTAGLSDTYALSEGEDYFDIDAGIHAINPNLGDDMGETCADETKELLVAANDDAGTTITAVNGTAIAVGGSVALASGATVTLTAAGSLVFDGTVAYADLAYGSHAMESFSYTATTVQGGFADATVDMKICGDVKSLEDVKLMLTGTVDFVVSDHFAAGDAFSITTNSVDNPLLNVIDSDNVFCVDLDGDVDTNIALTADVFLADPNDASLAAYVFGYQNLDLVNYILNQDYRSQGYTGNEIQDAIWYFTDDAYTIFQPNVAAIVAEAELNGEGFVAGEGDVVGLILAPMQELDDTGAEITNYQNFIYGVDYDLLADCMC